MQVVGVCSRESRRRNRAAQRGDGRCLWAARLFGERVDVAPVTEVRPWSAHNCGVAASRNARAEILERPVRELSIIERTVKRRRSGVATTASTAVPCSSGLRSNSMSLIRSVSSDKDGKTTDFRRLPDSRSQAVSDPVVPVMSAAAMITHES